MKTFKLSSGTQVAVDANHIKIDKNSLKSSLKGLLKPKATGLMTIKTNNVSGVIYLGSLLFICGTGLPTPTDFKPSTMDDVKYFPNCIEGSYNELLDLYNYLMEQI